MRSIRLLLDELDHASGALSDNDDVHVVLLTAEGEIFSRGWGSERWPMPTDRRSPGFRCLELMAQPVIACVQGEATGEGLELALACDVRIAAEGTTFAMPQVMSGQAAAARRDGEAAAHRRTLGGVGDDLAGAAARLRPRRCGAGWSTLSCPGRRSAAEGGGDWRRRSPSQGPLGVRYAKEAMREGMEMPLSQALRYETDLTIILQTTDDRAEGVRAFMEKRPPKFTGQVTAPSNERGERAGAGAKGCRVGALRFVRARARSDVGAGLGVRDVRAVEDGCAVREVPAAAGCAAARDTRPQPTPPV